MSVIKGIIYKRKKLIMFLLLLIISLSLIFTTNYFSSNNAVITFKRLGLAVVYPFNFVITNIGKFFQNTVNSISQLKKTRNEIKQLRTELEQYKKIIIDFNKLNNKIIELENQLELKKKISAYDSITCEIIGRNTESLFDIIIINKGSKDGVKPNMPVIGYTGGNSTLIGKVAEVSYFASKVITLQNLNFSVGGLITRDQSHIIVEGSQKKPDIIKLLYVPKDFKISNDSGDLVYTSGNSLIYPAGLLIGRITKIYPSKNYENFNEADLEIAIDLSKIDYVQVLNIDYNEDEFILYKGFID